MKWLPVAVFAVVASWTGVVGERADSPTHDASGTAGAEELGKRFIRGGRDESIVAFQDREIEAGAVTNTVCVPHLCCPCNAAQLAALSADANGATGLGKRFSGPGARDDASDADASMRVSTVGERVRDPRSLLQADTFTMSATIKPGPGVSLYDVKKGHVDAGCGSDNSKCSCEMVDGEVQMKGRGTTGSATGLIFSCDMRVVGPAGGQGSSCNWEIKMPYIGDNSYTFNCDGFAFLVLSGFHKSGTSNDGINVEVLQL
jgi:hypothetical protein